MSELTQLAAQNVNLVLTVLGLGLLLALYFAFRFQINFWWLNFWYALPLVGKLARLSRDTTHSSKPGWLLSEETLCGDYRKFIAATSEAEFRKRLSYMNKAQDLGRRPMPGWMVAVLAVLLVAEGLGFSYLLGKWMARDGTPNLHKVLMLAIVFVICVIMMFITHAAGRQLHRTGLVRRCDKEWRDSGQRAAFKTRDIMLDDDQSADDREPAFSQTVNRVGTSGSYTMVVIAVLAIASIASLSTWMRVEDYRAEMLRQTVVQQDDPFTSRSLPEELTQPQQQVDKQAASDARATQDQGGMAAFTMLAIIFVITQVVGIYAGYLHSFAGRQSREAYWGTRGHATFDDYLQRADLVIHAAQARLQTLQRNLRSAGSNEGVFLGKSFEDYLRERQRQAWGRGGLAAPPVAVAPASVRTLEEALAELERHAAPEQKKAFLVDLPPELKEQVVEHLKAERLRAEQARRRAADDDIDALFSGGPV